MMKKWIGVLLAVLLAAGVARCEAETQPAAEDESGGQAASVSAASPAAPAGGLAESGAQPQKPCFFTQMAQQAVENLGLSGTEDDIERIKAAYKYIIARTSYIEYDQPELVDSWRYADRCGQAPDIYQVMGAGPLLYGIGTCENYSAALVVLLRQMGYEAIYLTGLTYSVYGTMVDHAWVMVQLEDGWHHIDPQLEDNVMKNEYIGYYYFLKSDADFAVHHVWGDALPQPDDYAQSLPECPNTVQQQEGEYLPQDPQPDVQALVQQQAQRQAEYTGTVCALKPRGLLPPLPRDMEA